MLYKIEPNNYEKNSRVEIRTPADFGLKEKDIENFLMSRFG